jgi:hypothetical protein
MTAIAHFESLCVRVLLLSLVTKAHREQKEQPTEDAQVLFKTIKARVRGNRSSLTNEDRQQLWEAVLRTSYEMVSDGVSLGV